MTTHSGCSAPSRRAASGEARGGWENGRIAALAEIAVYRDVSKAVMACLGRTLHWSRPTSAILAAGIDVIYVPRHDLPGR
jgi:hypothetical protein